MKVDRKDLLAALTKVHGAVPNNTESLPVLADFRIMEGSIAATDLEVAVATSFELDDLDCLVPAEKLFQVIKRLKTETVDIEMEGDQLVIKAKGHRSKLKSSADTESFPMEDAMGDVGDDDWTGMPEYFTAGLQCVIPFAEDSRAQLSGVCWHPEGLIASDGHRLIKYAMDGPIGKEEEIFLGLGLVQLLVFLGQPEAYACLADFLVFRYDDTVVYGRPMDQTFPPNWPSYFPEELPADDDMVSVGKEISDGLGRVEVFAGLGEGSEAWTEVKFRENKLDLAYSGVDSIRESVRRKGNDDVAWDFFVDPTYLREALAVCDSMMLIQIENNSLLYMRGQEGRATLVMSVAEKED